MSLAASLRPSPFSLNVPGAGFRNTTSKDDATRAFYQSSAYINLNRMLLRFSHLILLTPDPRSQTTTAEDLTPLQQQTQSELWSPLQFHRTKWLHNIEGARSLLIQLERTAQGIQGQRGRQVVLKELAEKRALIRRLRGRVEEISREVEGTRGEAWQTQQVGSTADEGETLYDVLLQQRAQRTAKESADTATEAAQEQDSESRTEQDVPSHTEKDRDNLFTTSSTIRRRDTHSKSSTKQASTAQSAGISSHEKSMHNSAREQETLTTSLVSLATQLKQQARAFQFSLDQDKTLLSRAVEGLDRNISGLEAASKNMQFLKRMSEGEGWLGRMKLYAIIAAMWVGAIMLVFVGPKLRF